MTALTPEQWSTLLSLLAALVITVAAFGQWYHVTYNGRTILRPYQGDHGGCGPAALAFVPVDPGPNPDAKSWHEFNACDEQRIKFVFMAGGLMLAGTVVLGIDSRRRERTPHIPLPLPPPPPQRHPEVTSE